jgi:hypothetical protein
MSQLPCDLAIAQCKEKPVILVYKAVDKKSIIGKMEGRGGEAQGVSDP